MACDKCLGKLANALAPGQWKPGTSNTAQRGGRKTDLNELLSKTGSCVFCDASGQPEAMAGDPPPKSAPPRPQLITDDQSHRLDRSWSRMEEMVERLVAKGVLLEKLAEMERENKQLKAALEETRGKWVPAPHKDDHILLRSPFTREIMSAPPKPGFEMPSIKAYDGTSDPPEHLHKVEILFSLCGISDAIKCRAFPITLEKGAWLWYSMLQPGSMGSFKQLSQLFLAHFVGSRRSVKTSVHLLCVKQRNDEPLQAYIARFDADMLEIIDLGIPAAVFALSRGLRSDTLRSSLVEKAPQEFINYKVTLEALRNFDEGQVEKSASKVSER